MCFTGGFALAMAVDDDDARAGAEPAVAPVRGSARPASARSGSPTPTSRRSPARTELCVLAMRFTGDKPSRRTRFDHLREVFGDRLIAIEIENRPGSNPHEHPEAGALGRDRAPRRRARSPDARRAQPGARLLQAAPHRVDSARRRSSRRACALGTRRRARSISATRRRLVEHGRELFARATRRRACCARSRRRARRR